MNLLHPRSLIAAVLSGAAVGMPLTASALEIIIDQQTKVQSLNGLAEIARGEVVTITIQNTFKECFTYNATQLKAPPTPAAAAGVTKPKPSTVVIRTTHQRAITSYQVKIDKIDPPPKDCADAYKTHGDGTWTIPVATVGWDMEFSGGVVVDGLTDPKYYLQAGTTGNFTVTRDTNAQDRTNQRLGVFAHLVNTKWARDSDMMWVPLTVGLGFDDKTRYMIGTGLKMGDQWYATVGAVSGKRSSLPVGVTEGMTTTNQNLLGTLGSRSSTSWFISFTWNFLGGSSKSAVQGLFPAPKAADQPASGAGS